MKVILLDGQNVAYRMGFAHKFLASTNGEKTGVLFGATGLLVRLKKKFPDAKFVVVWDGEGTRGNCWRSKIFPGYKTNRTPGSLEDQKAREQVLAQIPQFQELLHTLYIPQLRVEQVEADDALSIFSFYLINKGFEPFIYSSDKDFCQLLHRGINLIRDIDKDRKFRLEDTEDTIKHFGCTPQNVVKTRAFLGDNSDGIGSAFGGVGPVGANKFLGIGVDPSIASFNALPQPVQIAAIKLKSNWGILHRNYQILQLIEDCSDCRLSTKQQKLMKDGMNKCLIQLQKSTKFSRDDYTTLVKFLAGYELQEAIKNRQELLHIQEI